MPAGLESALSKRLDCDTVVVNEHGSTEPIESILVPIAGGPHTDAVVAVASANAARVELLHVTSPDPGADALDTARELLDDAAASVPDPVPVETELDSASDPVARVIEESGSFDVTIIGAPTKGRLTRSVFGSRATTIREHAVNTVAMVRRN